MLTQSGQWFEMVETAFTEKMYIYHNIVLSQHCLGAVEWFVGRFVHNLTHCCWLKAQRIIRGKLVWHGYHLHWTPYLSCGRFSELGTNSNYFIYAQTTSRHGQSTVALLLPETATAVSDKFCSYNDKCPYKFRCNIFYLAASWLLPVLHVAVLPQYFFKRLEY